MEIASVWKQLGKSDDDGGAENIREQRIFLDVRHGTQDFGSPFGIPALITPYGCNPYDRRVSRAAHSKTLYQGGGLANANISSWLPLTVAGLRKRRP